jgi:hypothetical protein
MGCEEKKGARLAKMCQKQKGLAMNGENSLEIYIIENKTVSLSLIARVAAKKMG